MKEVIAAENIKLKVEASDWKDSMVKSGQLLIDSGYITKDYCNCPGTCIVTFKTGCQCKENRS